MPAKLKVNREAIKNLVIAHGVREAARIAGIAEGTVQAWSARYGWYKLAKTARYTVQPIYNQSPADALATSIQAHGNPRILSLVEKREYLASVVRTPIGKVDENSPLAHKVRRRTDENGTETEEVEMQPKLRAIELDARLAGELDKQSGGLTLNLGIVTGGMQ